MRKPAYIHFLIDFNMLYILIMFLNFKWRFFLVFIRRSWDKRLNYFIFIRFNNFIFIVDRILSALFDLLNFLKFSRQSIFNYFLNWNSWGIRRWKLFFIYFFYKFIVLTLNKDILITCVLLGSNLDVDWIFLIIKILVWQSCRILSYVFYTLSEWFICFFVDFKNFIFINCIGFLNLLS